MENRNFRLKLSVGNLKIEIEIEGDPEVIIQEFEKIKEDGLGRLLSQIPRSFQEVEINEGERKGDSNTTSHNSLHTNADKPYDNLNTVALKSLAGPEVEWVLIYSFYSSGFGKGKFTRDDILSNYEETGRETPSRKRNLTNNIKALLRYNWIKAITKTDFEFTNEGIKIAKKILDRKGPPVKK